MNRLRGVLILLFVSSVCAPVSAAVRFSDVFGIARVLATTYQHFVAEPALLKRLESAQVRDREIQEEYDAGFMTAREVEAARKNLATQGRAEYISAQAVDKGLAAVGEYLGSDEQRSIKQHVRALVPLVNLGEYEGARFKERRLLRYLLSLAEIFVWVARMRLTGAGGTTQIRVITQEIGEQKLVLERARSLLMAAGLLLLVGKNTPRTVLGVLLHLADAMQNMSKKTEPEEGPGAAIVLSTTCGICCEDFDASGRRPVQYGGCKHVGCLTCATTSVKHGYSGGDVPFSCAFCRAPYSSVVQVKAKSVKAAEATADQPVDSTAAAKAMKIPALNMRIQGLKVRLPAHGLPDSEKGMIEKALEDRRKELAALGGVEEEVRHDS